MYMYSIVIFLFFLVIRYLDIYLNEIREKYVEARDLIIV